MPSPLVVVLGFAGVGAAVSVLRLVRYGWGGFTAAGRVVRTVGSVELASTRLVSRSLSVLVVDNEAAPVRLKARVASGLGLHVRYFVHTRGEADHLANLLERATPAAPDGRSSRRRRIGGFWSRQGIAAEKLDVISQSNSARPVRIRVLLVAPFAVNLIRYDLTTADAAALCSWIRSSLSSSERRSRQSDASA